MADTWSYSAGEYGSRVTVYERTRGGNAYARVNDPSSDGTIRRSLGFPVRKDEDEPLDEEAAERAREYAEKQSRKLRKGQAALRGHRVTLARLFTLHRRYVTGAEDFTEKTVDHHERSRELWIRFLGKDKDPEAISVHEWRSFVRQRASGAIDARGHRVPKTRRDDVGAATVRKDLQFLHSVLEWATRFRTENDEYLLSENPVRGFALPEEKNPSRPVMSEARFRMLRSAAGEVDMTVTWGGKYRTVESYLPELLDIGWHTGRRIGAIRRLRRGDISLEPTETAPHGEIVFPESTDKEGRRTAVPLPEPARDAVDRLREKLPPTELLFPSPKDLSEPASRTYVKELFRAGEDEADLDHRERGGWHEIRRAFATDLRGHPRQDDVAAAGGWASARSMRESGYVHTDQDGMRKVLEDR